MGIECMNGYYKRSTSAFKGTKHCPVCNSIIERFADGYYCEVCDANFSEKGELIESSVDEHEESSSIQ